jgi:hypothetical protein
MILAGCVQSSVWAYDYKPYPVYLGVNPSTTGAINCGNFGYWSGPTLAPNGSIYCLPLAGYENGVAIQSIAKITPGSMNGDGVDYTSASISFISDGVAGRPTIPNFASPGTTTSTRYKSKGVLAPNGRLYFLPNGNGGSPFITTILSLDPSTDTWDLKDFATIATETGATAAGMAFSGGLLDTSGEWIYFLPDNNVTMRMAPRSVAGGWTNPSNPSTISDLYQVGYFTGANGLRFAAGVTTGNENPYSLPFDVNNLRLTIPPNATNASISSPSTNRYGNRFSNAVVHPNGKIYILGGSSNYIFILDPTKWGTRNEFYSSNALYKPNNASLAGFTQHQKAVVEKLKTGQSPSSLKIYLMSTSYNSSVAVSPTTLLGDMVLNPATDTITNTGISKNVVLNNSNSATINTSPVIFSNGVSVQTYTVGSNGGYINFLCTGDDFTSNKTTSVLGSAFEINQYYISGFGGNTNTTLGPTYTSIYNINGNAQATGRTGGSVPLGGAFKGMTIFVGGDNYGSTSKKYGGEHVSIKGFAPDVTYFNHTADDDDIYTIPSDLSTLGTSLYNTYFNSGF